MGTGEIPDLARTLMWGPSGPREAVATRPELRTHAGSLGVFGNKHRLCHLWCELSTPTVPKPQPACYPWA